tara:strand:+ start:936 stop:1370 length:435 start_codon:yes stop_codon:yes gene_type:complete
MIFTYENIDENNILKKFYQTKIEGTQIKKIFDKNHPLVNQKGLFATKEWHQYDIIGEYTGKVVELPNHSDYLIAFTNISYSACLDALDYGNEIRYINHYKNIKEIPNCKFVSTYINLKPVILVIITKHVKVNEEFLVDYCYNFS